MSEPTEGYFAALGEFIHAFSETERLMQEAVRHYAKTSHKIARAIFSGTRAKDCIDHINRILDATEDDRTKANLADAFAQLAHINTARNSIVHWGAQIMPDMSIAATNDFLAHLPKNIRAFPASPAALRAMQADLYKIKMHIRTATWGVTGSPAAEIVAMVNEVLKGAWLYKPPQQDAPQEENRRRRSIRRRQRGASPK